MVHNLSLILLTEVMAICQLAPTAPIPVWASSSDFSACIRTPDELSLVCPEKSVPDDVIAERGWRALKVEGPLPFSMVGVLADLVTPLAQGGVSIFALSTYNTDYILVKNANLKLSIRLLEKAGHHITVDG